VPPVNDAPDYSTADGKDWLYNHQIESKRCPDEPATETNIDLFFLYPTVCGGPTAYSQTHDGFVSIDDEGMRADTISMLSAKGAFYATGKTFASFTQVYAPYYRQANMADALAHAGNDSLLCDYLYKGLAYQDVTAALDYYFTTINPDGKRSYILAGHSQGSALLRLAMEHYFPTHTAYLKKMVACYAIGFGAGKNWTARVEAATGVKFANDTTSTGVYISYNTEGPGGTGQSKLWPADAVAVNPLTWTQSGVAGPESNTGAKLSVLEEKAYPGMYGAEISDHGTVVCRQIDPGKYADSSSGFGDRCLHAWDYAAYWNNIAWNGMQRAAQLAGWKPVKVTGLEDHTYIAQYMYKIGVMPYEAMRAGDTYWIPESATWAQVAVIAADGYKLASGKTSDKVNITVTETMQKVVLDVTGKTAVWDSQRNPDYLTAHDWVVNHALKPTEAKQMAKEPDKDTGVDIFFVYPTIADTASATTVNGFVDLDDPQMRGDETARTDGVWWEFDHQACVFNDFGNFYMPYYRQMNLANALDIADGAADYTEANKAFADSLYAGVAYADVTAALDVYFKYWNNGRKFILAAHSQGSAILRDVMEHYFTQDDAHKALLKNLVCSYQIGYGVGSSWLADLAQNTQSANGLPNGVKFAGDSTGTGCIVSWNLTGANATGKSLLLPADAVSINPLTWSLGGDMAGKSLNFGTAYKLNPDSIVPGEVSAQVNLTRGTVECSEMSDKYLNIPQFGEKSLHLNDYGAYWVNLRQNINERIHTATGKYPIEPIKADTLDCLHMVSLKDGGSVKLNKEGVDYSTLSANIQYSKDRKVWVNYSWNAKDGTSIALNQGDTIFFRAGGIGLNTAFSTGANSYYNFVFGQDDSIAAGGNVMSLYDASCEQDTMTKGGFANLFENARQLVSVPKLPATKLADYCYYGMFRNCTGLEVDTCLNDAQCEGTLLAVTDMVSAPEDWNKTMFSGCNGDAKYTASYSIMLGGHYCIKPYVETLLDEMTATVDTLKALKGKKINIKLGRTFVKDGEYNTVCLPFSLSAAQLAQSPLAGYSKLLEFTSAKVLNYGKADETLVINMSETDAIQAGHPYIIEWDSIGDTIVNPVFNGVTVTTEYATNKAQLDGAIMFFGTFTPFMVYENDMDFIFVDEKSQLSWPNRTNLFKAFRAYFQINKANPAGLRSGMNAIFGSDDEEGTTRVLDLTSSDDASKARKLMLEGRVVIERNGRYFDMTGKEVK